MSICMAGIDWKTANMDKREAFSFTNSQAGRLCSKLVKLEGIKGCVLLSTCNRAELYLSGDDTLRPAEILCCEAGIPEAEALFTVRKGETAVRHLMRVACGLCSQILGEDQIISQVKRAYQLAHEADSTDAELSQLFRLAVTAGKRSRTQVRLSAAPLSAAQQAVELVGLAIGSLQGKRALVIGNGEMGRLAASLLVSYGCEVTVTLRSYRHGQTIVPEGCSTIPYNERMALIESCDILFSATTSPHYTVSYEDMSQLAHIPQVICDLSVPRDIEPSIRSMDGVQIFLDMDSMGGQNAHVNTDNIKQTEAIIEEEITEFARWQSYRNMPKEIRRGKRFPLFIDLAERKCLVVGCGKIGARRAQILLRYGAEVTVVAPEGEAPEGVIHKKRTFISEDINGMFLVTAATNDRTVNHEIYMLCRQKDIFVSTADNQDECTFFFPAVRTGKSLSVGIVSDGSGHKKTAQVACAIEKLLKEEDT